MTGPLDGKLAVVIGNKGRLGPVWCAALSEAGARVRGCDLPEFDLRRDEDLACVPTPDVLVLNAGVDDRPGEDLGPFPRVEQARSMAETNLVGALRVLTEVGGRMVERGHGSIVLIASLYGLVAPDTRIYAHLGGWIKSPMYGATKAGVVSLTQYFGAYYGAQGVRVNALAPGGVVMDGDPLTDRADPFKAAYTAKIPMGRMCRPSDLAGPLVFLASDASSFITGHTIPLDGGFLAW